MMALFVLSELLNIAAGMWSVRHEDHRHLIKWVPSLHLYFPLGALAGWKAIYEVITMPFYWDKTHHGIFDTVHIQSEQRSGPTPTSLIPAITKASAILTQPAPRTPARALDRLTLGYSASAQWPAVPCPAVSSLRRVSKASEIWARMAAAAASSSPSADRINDRLMFIKRRRAPTL